MVGGCWNWELAHENFWSLGLEDFVYSMFACGLVLVCEF